MPSSAQKLYRLTYEISNLVIEMEGFLIVIKEFECQKNMKELKYL